MPISIGGPLGPGADEGFYLPGPPGSDNGDFWVGDYVRVHTGTGPFDYNEQDARVMAITITRNDDNAELDIVVELKTATAPASIVQSYTKTMDLGCFTSGWPDPPGEGNMLIAAAATRGANALYTSSNVPIGTTQPPDASCTGSGIAGTDYTFDGSIFVEPGLGPMAFAHRIGALSEPQVTRWQASNRIRVFYIEVTRLSGAPTASVDGAYRSGASGTFTSDDLPSPGPGWWFCLLSFMSEGPQDSLGSGDITMTPRSPALDLGLQGWTVGDGAAGYRPYSILVPLQVFGAGTDHVIVDITSGTPNNAGANYRWQCRFWPS